MTKTIILWRPLLLLLHVIMQLFPQNLHLQLSGYPSILQLYSKALPKIPALLFILPVESLVPKLVESGSQAQHHSGTRHTQIGTTLMWEHLQNRFLKFEISSIAAGNMSLSS